MVRIVVAFLIIALIGVGPDVRLAHGQTPSSGAATPVAIAGCDSDPASGLLLYTAWPTGLAGGDVVVADGAGQEMGRIALPAPIAALPMRAPGQALVWTETDEMYLVDALAGTAAGLDIPADAVGSLFPVPAATWGESGAGWWLLGGPRQPAAYLVNLDTGEAHDIAGAITSLGDQYSETLAAFVAPDDEHVLIWTGLGLYLIATDSPDTVRALGGDTTLAAPGFFRAGGAELVYSRVGADNQIEVVSENLALGTETVVALGGAGGGGGERRLLPQPLPNPEQALLVWLNGPVNAATGSALEVIDLDSGRTRFLISPGVASGMPVVDPTGERVLAGGPSLSGSGWNLVDLGSGEATALPELNGQLSLGGGISRWAFFLPPSAFAVNSDGEQGARYVSLDLVTGTVSTLLLQQAGATYSFPVVSGGANPHAVVRVADETRSGLLLLDLATGQARTVATGDDVAGAFSPDGCWLAAVTSSGTLTLIPVAGGEAVSLPGATPIWVVPAP